MAEASAQIEPAKAQLVGALPNMCRAVIPPRDRCPPPSSLPASHVPDQNSVENNVRVK